MVGHTHEDIDQMFSCFSRHLSKQDARTLPELVSEMRTAYTPEPTNVMIDCMFDVKRWMEGCVEEKITGHINQHQFKFVMLGGKAVTFYKKWSTSHKWLPDSNGTFLEDLENGKSQETTWFLAKLKINEDASIPQLESNDEEQRVNAQIEKLMDKQTDETQIVVLQKGNKRKKTTDADKANSKKRKTTS